jgi:hypothetical protein
MRDKRARPQQVHHYECKVCGGEYYEPCVLEIPKGTDMEKPEGCPWGHTPPIWVETTEAVEGQ